MARIPGIHLIDQFKNYIINGNFDIWQRATSFSNPSAGTYLADRFAMSNNGTVGTYTISQQAFTAGQTAVPNEPTFFIRWNQTAAGSGSTFRVFQQKIENARTLAGKTVTLSFWAQADSTRTLGVLPFQRFGTGGSPSADSTVALQNFTLGTTWQKFIYTFTLPSVSGKTFGTNGDDSFIIEFDLPLNTTMTIDIAQVMLNEGSSAAPFQLASGGTRNLAGELNLCQRYYEKSYQLTQPVGVGGPIETGLAKHVHFSTSVVSDYRYGIIPFKVSKRNTPTLRTWSANGTANTGANEGDTDYTANSAQPLSGNQYGFNCRNNTGGTLTLNSSQQIFFHWDADAEL